MGRRQAFGLTPLGAGVGVSPESPPHSTCMSSPPTWPTRKCVRAGLRLPGTLRPGVLRARLRGARVRLGWVGQGQAFPPGHLSELFVPDLLCRAAEAVLQGRADSILAYHQQNVPRAKLDQVSAAPRAATVPLRTQGWLVPPLTGLMLCFCPPAGPESATYPRTFALKHAVSGHPAVAATATPSAVSPGPGQRPTRSAF